MNKGRACDEEQSLEKDQLIEQSLKYTADLARLYQEEKNGARRWKGSTARCSGRSLPE